MTDQRISEGHIDQFPLGYAYHKIVCDAAGKPCDYTFIQVNSAFETLTGLTDVVGKRVTEVLPDIVYSEYNWIDSYGEIALQGESREFEQYSEPLGRWYKVKVYSPESGYFITLFSDITDERHQIEELEELAAMTEGYLQTTAEKIDYQNITDQIRIISGAKFAAFNLYDDDGTHFSTMAIAGVKDLIHEAMDILGIELEGKQWSHDRMGAARIKDQIITRFTDLSEWTGGVIPRGIMTLMKDRFHIGETLLVKISQNAATLGDFILFMPKEKVFNKDRMVELYAKHLGLVIQKKRAQDQLAQAHQQYKSLVANTPGITYRCEPDKAGTMIFMSEEVLAITGYPPTDFIGNKVRSYESVIHREDVSFVSTIIQDAIWAGKEWDISYRICHKDGEVRWINEKGRVVQGEAGKPAFCDGFIFDVTKQRQAEEALRESEELNKSIVNTLPDIVFKISATGEHLDVITPQGHKLCLPKEELVGKNIAETLPRETADIILDTTAKAFLTNTLQRCEYAMTMDAGSRYYEARIVPADEKTAYALVRDITNRKEAEMDLAESKKLLDLFFSQSLSGFSFMMLDEPIVWNGHPDKETLLDHVIENLKFTKVNQAMLDQYGATEEEFIGLTPKDLFAHDVEQARRVWKSLMEQGRLQVETYEQKRDGSPMVIEGDYICLNDEQGRVLGHFRVQSDITARKEAQQAIIESEERFRQISDNISEVFWLRNADSTKMIYINPAYEQVWGRSRQDLYDCPMSYIDAVYDNDKPALLAELERYSEEGDFNIEYRIVRPNGEIRWVQAQSFPVRNSDGEVVGHTGIAVDITKQKHTEEKIKESEQRFKTLFHESPVPILVHDKDTGDIVDANEMAWTAFGLSGLDDLKSRDLWLKTPYSKKEALAWIQKAAREGTQGFEWKNCRVNGEIFWVNVVLRPIMFDGIERVLATSMDITERKQAEEEINLHITISENAAYGIAYADIDGHIAYVNTFYANIHGYSPDEIIGRHFSVFHTSRQLDRVGQIMDHVLQTGRCELNEVWHVHRNGSEFPMLMSCLLIRDGEGNPQYIACSAIDFTERKVVEEQLFKEKEQFETTLLSVSDGVISTNVEGTVLIMNRVAEQYTGWTQEEAVGRPAVEVYNTIQEFSRQRSPNLVLKVLETGDIVEVDHDNLLISKDGIERPIEDSAAPVRDEQGQITGAVLVFRDITEKKNRQAEIEYLSFHDHLTGLHNRRFFEKELNRLDKEGHWPLTIVMGDVNGLKLINDSFGHATGDNLLIKAADAIKTGCRGDSIIARIGGDEFVILLPKADDSEAENLIKRINKRLKKQRIGDIEISISFGYASKKIEMDDVEAVFKKAEDRMYHNKLFEGPSIRGKVIDNIVDALNKKSKRERAHGKRVSELCERMGVALELKDEKIKELKILGLLHDIGKIAVSDDILNKPGGLRDSEWAEMIRHSEIGYRILSTANDMSEIAEYVLAHHERWDGKGYPKGLKGEAIPFESRVIAIADAYDAMTSERSYKSSLAKEVALAELQKNAGFQFDPELVRVFVDKGLYLNGD
jgi:diguanylate cyclase